jgi:hypothetical protein
MNWFDNLSNAASNIYDNTVKTGTDYFNTKISGFSRDPAPVQTTGNTGGGAARISGGGGSITKTAETAGLFGYSWSAIAAMAAVFGVVVLLLKR